MKSILVLFHCKSNTGYAIEKLEPIFFRMALALCNGDQSRIHVAYSSIADGRPSTLPNDFNQYLAFDTANASAQDCLRIQQYLQQHEIDTLFGFDQPVHRTAYKYFRAGGIRHFVSYWGAPMSSIFGPLRQTLKRLEVALRRYGPDHYIFESRGMADTAVLGRGIPASRVHVTYLGVDTDRFRPSAEDKDHAYKCFSIPKSRKIFFYSGHMEPRKGVATIMHVANYLAKHRMADDWHILLTGNKENEENYLLNMLDAERAKQHVTFGGYRNDIEVLHRSCHAGIIASTGWDSLTCSSLEMQASGLPLLLSALPGLREAIEDGVSGMLFTPGDHVELAKAMELLLNDVPLHQKLSLGARTRIEATFSDTLQLERLVSIMRQLTRS